MRQEWTRRRFMKLGAAGSLAGWVGEQGADFQGERAAADEKSLRSSDGVNGQNEIPLPPPVQTGGAPITETLVRRKSTRSFAPKNLRLDTISNLLWAACGQNRPDGRRTVPSPMNSQETSLYLIFEAGTYRYDAAGHRLVLIEKGDLRDLAGVQTYTRDAPMTILFVADLDRLTFSPEEDRRVFAAVDAGFIGQNVYLFAAAEGMAAVFRSSIDRKGIEERFHLPQNQFVFFAQSVGYPNV